MLDLLALLALSASAPAQGEPRAPQPLEPLPSARQLAWHARERTAFIYFGMNTFTDREWGMGDEGPELFDPEDLDARQWVRVLRDGGIEQVILTAKHHDGFCLWPSRFTEHSVAKSPWRGGNGDLLRELSEACREHGLAFGVYLSPWDRNAKVYGDSPAYNDYYVNQLTELLANYGPISEVWWDGACGEGPNGKRQVYDWPRFTEVVRRLAPEAVIFSDIGPDVRWVGNESGFAGETCWAMLSVDGYGRGADGPPQSLLNEGDPAGRSWIPAECDVSIRPGWFFHAAENERVKSIADLMEVYERSVGHGAVWLLNVPADKRGRIHEIDAARLLELRRVLEETFALDLARAGDAAATNVRGGEASFGADKALDGDPSTYWATDDGTAQASLTVELRGGPRFVSHVVLAEPIALGQRVGAFIAQALVDDAWREIGRGTTIGRKRILRFAPVMTRAVRLTILGARACPLLSTISVFAAAPEVRVATSARSFVGSLAVELASDLPGAEIRWSFVEDGKPGEARSYAGPITLSRSAVIRAEAVLGERRSVLPLVASFRGYSQDELRAPISFVRAPDPGLRWRAHEGSWPTLEALKGAAPLKEGTCDGFDVGIRTRDEHAAVVFEGFVQAPRDGIYTFATTSDDGSRLWIGDDLVVANDGSHGLEEKSGEAALRAGFHPMRVAWFNATGGAGLQVTWSGPGILRERIPPGVLFR